MSYIIYTTFFCRRNYRKRAVISSFCPEYLIKRFNCAINLYASSINNSKIYYSSMKDKDNLITKHCKLYTRARNSRGHGAIFPEFYRWPPRFWGRGPKRPPHFSNLLHTDMLIRALALWSWVLRFKETGPHEKYRVSSPDILMSFKQKRPTLKLIGCICAFAFWYQNIYIKVELAYLSLCM